MDITQLEHHINSFRNLFNRFTVTADSLPLIAGEIEAAENELERLDKENEQLYTMLRQLPGNGTVKLKTALRIEINRAKIHNALSAGVETMVSALTG